MYEAFKFKGFVYKRSIRIFNTSFRSLRNNYKFRTIFLSKEGCSFLVGNSGKILRYHDSDRSIRFHVPQSCIKNYKKEVMVEIRTEDKELVHYLKHIKGKVKLKNNNFWFKSDSSKKFKNSTQISINSRPLGDYFHKRGIKKIYVDIRKNYAIIKPINIEPSRNSFISKVWLHSKKNKEKVSFFIPKICDIQYVCIVDSNFKINKRFFQMKEEFELAEELSKKYNILCISQAQSHDIKILNINNELAIEETVINIKNIKRWRSVYYHLFSDILKGIIFFSKNKKRNFVIINEWWSDYKQFINFFDMDILNFSEELGVKIIFTNYKKKWFKNTAKQIENHLSSSKDKIALARSP